MSAALLVAVVALFIVVFFWIRDSTRSYRSELEGYLRGVRARDPVAAAQYVCESVAASLREDPAHWSDQLAEQAEALNNPRQPGFRRGSQHEARLTWQTDTGQVFVGIPVADEDGKLSPCPSLTHLFGTPD